LTIFIAGSGLIGKALQKTLINSSNQNVSLLSIRNLSLEEINNNIINISDKDVFVDSMDPNTLNQDIKEEHLKKIESIRSMIFSLTSNFHYIFLSTASIYAHNCELIDERMLLQKDLNSHYLKMKVKNEILVKSLAKPPFTIARLASIWSDENQDSFFGDLIKAFKEKSYIKTRYGDEKIISYINLSDACQILKFIILKKITGVLNVCTNQYNSRSNLKAIVNNTKTKPISDLAGLRINSCKLNWEEILGQREELF
tara:strand:+ start:4040 stop:4807 length:768 start_codon:yes stop_codon:yes gene_type:complete